MDALLEKVEIILQQYTDQPEGLINILVDNLRTILEYEKENDWVDMSVNFLSEYIGDCEYKKVFGEEGIFGNKAKFSNSEIKRLLTVTNYV